MYLEEIIENVELESDKFECKAKLYRDDIVGWLKSVAGFANAYGGDFYIGVEDKTNKLIGFDRVAADNERNYFNNQVNEHLVPRPQMTISFIRYEIKGKERFIIHVQVENSIIKPIILKYKNIPSIFMRRDGFTNGATYEEIIDMSIKCKNTQYDILTSDVKYDASKFTILRNFYSEHNDGKKMSEKALKSMGFYNEDDLLANGALLFADDYQEKKTEVKCSVFSGFRSNLGTLSLTLYTKSAIILSSPRIIPSLFIGITIIISSQYLLYIPPCEVMKSLIFLSKSII